MQWNMHKPECKRTRAAKAKRQSSESAKRRTAKADDIESTEFADRLIRCVHVRVEDMTIHGSLGLMVHPLKTSYRIPDPRARDIRMN